MRSEIKGKGVIAAITLGCVVASCAGSDPLVAQAGGDLGQLPGGKVNGPQADYPMVIGDPFTVDGVLYTPSDTMNYDEVGYAGVDDPGASGVTAAHRTLPLPSYVEITDLDSGRTILARVERRGPMTGARLIGLAPAALRQLGAREGSPVRVRRVNPPEDQRADLRADGEAPLRMETPEGLLAVLRRKLSGDGVAPPLAAPAPEVPVASPAPESDPPITTIDPDTAGPVRPAPVEEPPAPAPGPAPEVDAEEPEAPPPERPAASGNWVVQAGAFSAKPTAERIAAAIGGYIEPAGRLWRVRAGPFETRGQADAALAKVRGAGYRDAQVFSIR